MRRPLAALAAALLTGCQPLLDVPARAPEVRAVRIVTWNVHDLFDAEDRLLPPGAEDEVPSTAEVEAKLGALAAVLARLDADVVLLQEVENLALLEALAEGAGYEVARLVEGNDPRGIDVAALSRRPISRYVSHAGERDAAGRVLWPRDCAEVHLAAGATRLAIVMSHLSSRLSDDGTRRAAQAARMREIADALAMADPDAVVLAGGDLNDPPTAPALGPLAADGSYLDPLPAEATTWSTGVAAERLDALLVARGHAGAVVRAEVVHGTDVARASDHQPIVLDLRLP
ncbi:MULTISPECIES: endonuclease/exonuclease/phosphatase family protein [Anaeromyxobacter]|uniref:endonuclease/exonuclease/phosphatase family protein n=1 Tax=Anaeromyxobacter TaxID=161492 RepID=UPI001F5845A7|nr:MULTISPECIES: endonuclease/exonuclease/phosphatase family protein [unclassified Anaeromyxobacter]